MSQVVNILSSVFCCSNSNSGKSSKKVDEEEKLLKLFQGANKSQDGFMQWCEQMLHTLNTANNLDGEVLSPICMSTHRATGVNATMTSLKTV